MCDTDQPTDAWRPTFKLPLNILKEEKQNASLTGVSNCVPADFQEPGVTACHRSSCEEKKYVKQNHQ